MFHSARLKLTLWYVLVALIVTVFFSLLAYNSLGFEVERGLQRQRIYLQQNMDPSQPPSIIFSRLNPALQHEIRERLLERILYIDTAIIILVAAGGYLLAGRTLKPIKEMVDEQNRFITDASHELRTPLTSMRTELEATLLSKKLSEKEAREVLTSNLEEVVHLQNLSNNLLELATAKKPPKKKTIQTLSLTKMLNEVIKKLKPLADEKKISFTLNLEESHLIGEQSSLRELFIILLDNAIKYSHENTEVTISSKKKEKFAVIKVSDQGIGIPKADREKIFDRFFRSDKSRSKVGAKGYGLGLAIAKQIVADHNGQINVESKLDHGTTFIVQLPRK